jgi:pyruvate dehydrogenase E2 component (dihydrolipoamide acetyltransferase)
MAREFRLPDLGEGIHEGEIVEVLVAAGSRIEEGEPLIEVETDKAVTALPSPFTGTVLSVGVKAGDTVRVGDVLVVFEDAAGGRGPAAGRPRDAAPGGAPPSPDAADGHGRAPAGGKAGGEKAAASLRDRPPVPASPATRRLARELGVDLYAVEATGDAGRVTAEDVRRHAARAPEDRPGPAAADAVATAEGAGPPPGAMPDFSRWGPVEEEPLRSVRRATARQMALAWSQIPHVSNQDLADVTDLDALRRRKAPAVEAAGGRLTLTAFAVKAVVTALKRFPRFNASIDMAAGRIVYKRYHHIGIAMDTDRGLIVPVLRDADRKSIAEIAVELNELVARARTGKVAPEDLQGGTFTITNAGAVGGGFFAPIINHPRDGAGPPPARGPSGPGGPCGRRAEAPPAPGGELRPPHRRRRRGDPVHAGGDGRAGRSRIPPPLPGLRGGGGLPRGGSRRKEPRPWSWANWFRKPTSS